MPQVGGRFSSPACKAGARRNHGSSNDHRQAFPTLTWANPANIVYGTALGASQLNAAATYNSTNVPGTFTYTNAAGTALLPGTALGAGSGQTLYVTFTPTHTATFHAGHHQRYNQCNPRRAHHHR